MADCLAKLPPTWDAVRCDRCEGAGSVNENGRRFVRCGRCHGAGWLPGPKCDNCCEEEAAYRILTTAGETLLVEADSLTEAKAKATAAGHEIVGPRCCICHGTGLPFLWPSAVIQLAESVRAGEDCCFALHAALLEFGQPTLAEHFSGEKWRLGSATHPADCWALAAILGRDEYRRRHVIQGRDELDLLIRECEQSLGGK